MESTNKISELYSLKNKNILVTGASSGIGRKSCILFSQLGANVILVGRREEKLKETYNSLEKGKHLLFVNDITDFERIETIVNRVIEEIGFIDGFVHSAGLEIMLPITMMKPLHYLELFKINVIAGFEFARILSKKRYFNENRGASFVFISSVMGFLGDVAHTGYCASKGALISGVKAMALEFAPKKIRVNAISPAQIEDTEMTKTMFSKLSEENINQKLLLHPLGFGTTEDVANVIAFLLSDASRWITGTNLIIDGGYSAR